jgi:hypothetical protein
LAEQKKHALAKKKSMAAIKSLGTSQRDLEPDSKRKTLMAPRRSTMGSKKGSEKLVVNELSKRMEKILDPLEAAQDTNWDQGDLISKIKDFFEEYTKSKSVADQLKSDRAHCNLISKIEKAPTNNLNEEIVKNLKVFLADLKFNGKSQEEEVLDLEKAIYKSYLQICDLELLPRMKYDDHKPEERIKRVENEELLKQLRDGTAKQYNLDEEENLTYARANFKKLMASYLDLKDVKLEKQTDEVEGKFLAEFRKVVAKDQRLKPSEKTPSSAPSPTSSTPPWFATFPGKDHLGSA